MRIGLLLALVVGCGGGGKPANSDAHAVDAHGDALGDALGDAALGSATVTVRSMSHQTPTANAPVLFTDASGTSTELYTDANGQVNTMLSPNTTVTTITDDGQLATIVGAMPGDQLTFGLGRFHPAPTLTVNFTALADGASYTLYSPCLHTSVTPPSTSVDLIFCNGQITDTDVYVIGTTSTMAATASAHHVDLTAGTITIPNTWTPFRTIDVTYTGFAVGENLAAGSYDVPESYNGGPGSLSTPRTTMTLPAGAPAQLINTDVETLGQASQSFLDRVAPIATTYTLSASELRPWITSLTFDAATRTVSSSAPAGLAADVAMTQLIWDPGNGGGGQRWTVYARPFQTFTLPALPADMPDPMSSTAHLTMSLAVFDNSSLTDWDAARARVYDVATLISNPDNVPDRLYLQRFAN